MDPFKTPQRFLDVGCGSGAITISLLQECEQVGTHKLVTYLLLWQWGYNALGYASDPHLTSSSRVSLTQTEKSLVCNNYEPKEFRRVVHGYNSGNALLCCHGVEIMLCIPEHFLFFIFKCFAYLHAITTPSIPLILINRKQEIVIIKYYIVYTDAYSSIL